MCPGALKQTTAAAKPNIHTSAVSLGDCKKEEWEGEGKVKVWRTLEFTGGKEIY